MAMDEAIAHFGLGDDERIERLTIEWPSGHVQTFDDLPVDQHSQSRTGRRPAASTPPKPPPTMFRAAMPWRG